MVPYVHQRCFPALDGSQRVLQIAIARTPFTCSVGFRYGDLAEKCFRRISSLSIKWSTKSAHPLSCIKMKLGPIVPEIGLQDSISTPHTTHSATLKYMEWRAAM